MKHKANRHRSRVQRRWTDLDAPVEMDTRTAIRSHQIDVPVAVAETTATISAPHKDHPKTESRQATLAETTEGFWSLRRVSEPLAIKRHVCQCRKQILASVHMTTTSSSRERHMFSCRWTRSRSAAGKSAEGLVLTPPGRGVLGGRGKE